MSERMDEAAKLAVIEEYARTRSVADTAEATGATEEQVRRTIEDPKFLVHARALVQANVGIEFFGECAQTALSIMRDTRARATDRMGAIKFLNGLLETVDVKERKRKDRERKKAEAEVAERDESLTAITSRLALEEEALNASVSS